MELEERRECDPVDPQREDLKLALRGMSQLVLHRIGPERVLGDEGDERRALLDRIQDLLRPFGAGWEVARGQPTAPSVGFEEGQSRSAMERSSDAWLRKTREFMVSPRAYAGRLLERARAESLRFLLRHTTLCMRASRRT